MDGDAGDARCPFSPASSNSEFGGWNGDGFTDFFNRSKFLEFDAMETRSGGEKAECFSLWFVVFAGRSGGSVLLGGVEGAVCEFAYAVISAVYQCRIRIGHAFGVWGV